MLRTVACCMSEHVKQVALCHLLEPAIMVGRRPHSSKAHYGAWMWSVHMHGTFFLVSNPQTLKSCASTPCVQLCFVKEASTSATGRM